MAVPDSLTGCTAALNTHFMKHAAWTVTDATVLAAGAVASLTSGETKVSVTCDIVGSTADHCARSLRSRPPPPPHPEDAAALGGTRTKC